MKRTTWKKHHKWLGILFTFFMLMFCVSGLVLNHREAVADINVDRTLLPSDYSFNRWNRGLIRGTLKYDCSMDELSGRVFIYGNSGIWKTDSAAAGFTDFNYGLPSGADFRNIKGMSQTIDGSLWAAGQFDLYRYDVPEKKWIMQHLPLQEGEKISDITTGGDTLVVTGRSHLYISLPPYDDFEAYTIQPYDGYDGNVSLFRTIWMLHSGEMFGLTGKLVVDGVAVVLIVLCITGILYWLLPKHIRNLKRKGKDASTSVSLLRESFRWHNGLGRYTFFILMFVAFTGWCLRPPVLIALVSLDTPAIPHTELDSDNPWNDRLRMLRYDSETEDWLLSTSEGIYSLSSLYSKPHKIEKAPPVSVMGMNVFHKDDDGSWLVGSFSGMFRWDRHADSVTDYFTGEIAEETSGPPFGKFAVSGYSDDFLGTSMVVEYNEGTDIISMPDEFKYLPMSLWNLALEVHTGRIYTVLGQGTLIYIFFAGAIAMWCLYSGYVIRKRK